MNLFATKHQLLTGLLVLLFAVVIVVVLLLVSPQ
jgi:hypothetical protein